MEERNEVIVAGRERIALWHRVQKTEPAAHVVVMHGAGQSSSARYEPLCAQLALHDISSTRFDFSGHGLSSANTAGSLKKRLFEARHVLEHLPAYVAGGAVPVYLLASSMSGEIAIRLSCSAANDGDVAVSGMMLIAPAVYSHKVFDIDFGPAFTAILRTNESWNSALALSLLRRRHAPILLIRPGQDLVIPSAVTDAIIESGMLGGNVEEIVIPDASHALIAATTTNARLLAQLVQHCCRFMSRTTPG